VRLRKGKRFLGEERIVERVEQEDWQADERDKPPGAGLFPVVLRIAKAVDAGGEAVVELREAPNRMDSRSIDLLWEPERLRGNFRSQALHKTPEVNPVAASAVQSQCTGGQIDGR
jgi:hypothetical protein